MHAIRMLHLEIYRIGKKLPKGDKLGIHAEVERKCFKLLSCSIEAAYRPRKEKTETLVELRLTTEVLKNIWRTECELGIVDEKTYLRIAEKMVEISKMTNGWITYTQKGA
ncbi:MAG TPA: four helix bundle protein [Candidatus Paceibacterota bacterium]